MPYDPTTEAPRDMDSSASYWTTKEIFQQPRIWLESAEAVDDRRDEVDDWLAPLLSDPNLRIILTGAGTSAFIGDTLAPWLTKKLDRNVESISTTDIVSDPGQYLLKSIPTLLVSFARSGNSPESVASVELANQTLNNCHHLVLTCNTEGFLAESTRGENNMFCLLMPEGTNDRSFAMTSSYSSMLVSAASIFSPDLEQVKAAVKLTEKLFADHQQEIRKLAQRDFSRLVVLGAGCLLGTAREASLKCLELSAGQVMPMFDSPLGFRHGPKSVVDKSTMIIHFHSSDPYIGAYDLDLYNEVQRDGHAAILIELSPKTLESERHLEDLWLSLPYIVYCQLLALYKAQVLQVSADNPCPSGEVNRVVQGVTIHSYAQRGAQATP